MDPVKGGREEGIGRVIERDREGRECFPQSRHRFRACVFVAVVFLSATTSEVRKIKLELGKSHIANPLVQELVDLLADDMHDDEADTQQSSHGRSPENPESRTALVCRSWNYETRTAKVCSTVAVRDLFFVLRRGTPVAKRGRLASPAKLASTPSEQVRAPDLAASSRPPTRSPPSSAASDSGAESESFSAILRGFRRQKPEAVTKDTFIVASTYSARHS
jgi:hypothetical protein